MKNRSKTFKPLETSEKLPYFTYEYPHEKWKIGDWILIQHLQIQSKLDVEGKAVHSISEPILALFVGFSVWDQALVINYVQPVREEDVFTSDPEVEHICLWHDNAIVLGHWDTMPKISDLRNALKNKK